MITTTDALRLQSVRVRNFKAIVDSRTLVLGPLTVFIGHNGSGKSSLIEALETYKAIVADGLDAAMQRWLGIEHVRHKSVEAKERAGKPINPMSFDLRIGASERKSTHVEMAVNKQSAMGPVMGQPASRNRRKISVPQAGSRGAIQLMSPKRVLLA